MSNYVKGQSHLPMNKKSAEFVKKNKKQLHSVDRNLFKFDTKLPFGWIQSVKFQLTCNLCRV